MESGMGWKEQQRWLRAIPLPRVSREVPKQSRVLRALNLSWAQPWGSSDLSGQPVPGSCHPQPPAITAPSDNSKSEGSNSPNSAFPSAVRKPNSRSRHKHLQESRKPTPAQGFLSCHRI